MSIMTLEEIRRMPTTLKCKCGERTHESVLRSHHIVDKVRDLVEAGISKGPLLELISDLRLASPLDDATKPESEETVPEKLYVWSEGIGHFLPALDADGKPLVVTTRKKP